MQGVNLPSVGVYDVASVDGGLQASAVRRLLTYVRESSSIAFSGRRILLNPNTRWLTRPAYRNLVAGMATALGRRGASVLLADRSNLLKGGEGLFPATGGGNLDAAPPWQTVEFDRRNCTRLHLGSHIYRLPRMVFEVDLVVNIAGLFIEPRAQLAGAIYNMLELLCGRNRRTCPVWSLDANRFNAAMVDIVSRAVPDLNLLAAPGADGLTQVLISTDMVAVDTLAATMAGLDPQEIPAVSLAAESGLGIGWIEAIRLVGDRPRTWLPVGPVESHGHIKGPDLPVGRLHTFQAQSETGQRSLASVRPVAVTYCNIANSADSLTPTSACVGEDRCDACRRCAKPCPILLN